MDFFRLGQDGGDQGGGPEGQGNGGLREEDQGQAGRLDSDRGAGGEEAGGQGSAIIVSRGRGFGGAGRCGDGSSRSGVGASSPGGSWHRRDRGCLGLGGEGLIGFGVGFCFRSRGCCRREIFVKDIVGGVFEVRFGVKIGFKVIAEMGQY